MIGADSTSYVNSGLQGAQAAPTIALIIILVASLLYIWCMYLMFKAVVGSIRSGSYDLGLGTYKDKVQATIGKVSRSISNLRMSHAYEDTEASYGDYGSGSGAVLAGTAGSRGTTGSGSTKRKRRGGVSPSGGAGSGARALQGNASTKSQRVLSALDDHESVDAAIERGNKAGAKAEPAVSLDDYLASPTKTEKKK
jgi:hypothetical protein